MWATSRIDSRQYRVVRPRGSVAVANADRCADRDAYFQLYREAVQRDVEESRQLWGQLQVPSPQASPRPRVQWEEHLTETKAPSPQPPEPEGARGDGRGGCERPRAADEGSDRARARSPHGDRGDHEGGARQRLRLTSRSRPRGAHGVRGARKRRRARSRAPTRSPQAGRGDNEIGSGAGAQSSTNMPRSSRAWLVWRGWHGR
jgi:hypothetical protein